ncbi:MAG: proteasome-activating nucleotidase [Candidatus Methanomethylophilaceae archaeon]|jgi:proteasome regulatory subunit|nr:proteasome-activating nucleotidase [Candidatus Methanomethylophilaceae archaeon]NCA73623.1 AAA family ATPase [Gammaproteobacteria bacterium]MDD3351645.1 proteasome-activating nucleotidase [Candidatus Methanomethylophilaceae archaeon]MDD3986877.1 proteasome-activating nucleotidase [Candidatus Methanomethylophilaceae archaeon]MDD4708952.1 proteasome-activating nucleotidase [Candidatus Methanomethylophilaceae archaeon]
MVDQAEGETAELKAKIVSLEERNVRLMEDLQNAENEKRFSESELFRLQKDLTRVRTELERLRSPPLIIGSLRDVLPDNRVVVKSSTGPDFIVSVSEYVPKEDLIPGARVSLNKQTLALMNILPSSLDPIVTGAEIIEKPDTTYDDIGGLKQQMLELREAVEDPLLRPELYTKVGIEPPKGVLLVGPPGTGKTLMAKAVANATNATFVRLVGSELVQKYIGEGARLVRELFELARDKAPSIIFIDELDSVGAKRLDAATSGDREVQRTLMQLLAELDGFKPSGDVKIIGATNRPDILDDALLRPGRFDRIIDVGMPDSEGRLQIFKIHTSHMNVGTDVNLKMLAEITDTASGAEIKSICTEAGMLAIRDGRDTVTMSDFMRSKEKVMEAGRNKIKAAPAYMFG